MRLTTNKRFTLIVGDILLFILFSWMGRISHQMPVQFSAILFTALPFIFTWLMMAPTFGLYQDKGLNSLSQTLIRTGAAVMVSIPAAVWLRAVLVHHNFDWLFYCITFLTLMIFFLAWRLIFTWAFLRSLQ